ncbi:MAG: enoyl-CoA hydratase/isomerase family protein [Cognatishimia sp.]|uniref:FAD-dependent oxidoreductase n=1 Tax=Cognatishimia sp. TaxID=2211648 RepID=UPI003B8C3827
MNAVTVEIKGDIAWVKIDNAPVNATSTEVRQGLLDTVAKVRGYRMAVLYGAGRTFIAGGDMSEFDLAPQEPHLPDVVQAIEDSETPFLAALHGSALGGGLEVAMACAWRIAAPNTKFGLPEVNVGLIPGAGGTQRAPRLLGWDIAESMACTGKIYTAEKLLAVGAVDLIADDPLVAASEFIADRPLPVSQRPAPQIDQEWLAEKRATLTNKSRGQKSPFHNLTALSWAAEPYALAQPKERALHLELRRSDESKALRHIFFAERKAVKPKGIAFDRAKSVETIAIVGGGLMGTGIAAACLNAGYTVTIIEQSEEAADRATNNVTKILEGALKRRKIDQIGFDARLSRFTSNVGYNSAASADLVIEAVFEDLDVKQQVMAALENVVAPETILATNTSYLDPQQIFAKMAKPDRCVGLHFFSPAHIMKLVEVVKLPSSAPETLATAFAVAKNLRKTPVLSGICDGFIGNRILASYRRAAEYLLADGALPHEIDAAMRQFGMAMGPFEVQDMSGLQIALSNRRRQDSTRPENERYVTISDQLCTLGRFGKRVGKGWHRYESGNHTPHRDPLVEAIIQEYSAAESITRRTFQVEEIQQQLLAAMANEGALIVEEGIAQSADDVDVVKVHGYGFPRWRGGPMQAAKALGHDLIQSALATLEESSPNSWRRARLFT